MKFLKSNMSLWKGRYSRIEGHSPVFHVRWNDACGGWGICIDWDKRNGRYFAVKSTDMDELADAVSEAKRKMEGSDGGSFQVNEFGQVLVPSNKDGDRRRKLAGEISGGIEFRDLEDDGDSFVLPGSARYETMGLWDLPYIGMPFILNADGRICYEDDEGERQFPDSQDNMLIKKLQETMGKNCGRFIVNPWGEVLTKPKEEPLYVGKIDRDYWFNKEGG